MNAGMTVESGGRAESGEQRLGWQADGRGCGGRDT